MCNIYIHTYIITCDVMEFFFHAIIMAPMHIIMVIYNAENTYLLLQYIGDCYYCCCCCLVWQQFIHSIGYYLNRQTNKKNDLAIHHHHHWQMFYHRHHYHRWDVIYIKKIESIIKLNDDITDKIFYFSRSFT